MTLSASYRTWEEACSPAAARLAGRFEADWRASPPGRRPDPGSYLAEEGQTEGARLALLRAEFNLRHEDGEPVSVEAFRRRYPDLSEETLIALIYEEFCLREEVGENPQPEDYFRRYPNLAESLRRVLDVHDLVGAGSTSSLGVGGSTCGAAVPFPEAGQTIAGFHLVEEVGRGAFARVFRAEERQLANRPVALKVARNGSREPQMLARLQHTHIVPVHSYRTDPVTGLHLLCMPFLGGVTLARLLSEPDVKTARTGAELLAAIDRLQPTKEIRWDHSGSRKALAERSYERAIAWWGARLAEALQHAHERGMLHRDIKPSNVLVTPDGLPMLLDFNLAWEPRLDDPSLAPVALGGTLAYMAPEHLEALADGKNGGVDVRSDLFALGVVLHEAMGSRPFPIPSDASTISDALLRAAEQRRVGPPRIRESQPRVRPEFEAVVRRCLEPDPEKRYQTAAHLAADLQAVADDAPLRHAREPVLNRSRRWLRRNRVKLAVAVPLALAPLVIGYGLVASELENIRLTWEIQKMIEEGVDLLGKDAPELAEVQFANASELANRSDGLNLSRLRRGQRPTRHPAWSGPLTRRPTLTDLRAEAREGYRLAAETKRLREAADVLVQRATLLRLHLLGFTIASQDVSQQVEDCLAPFYVLESENWLERPDMQLLDQDRFERLQAEVDDLLFLWAVWLEHDPTAENQRMALEICRKGLRISRDSVPWRALRQRCVTGKPVRGAGSESIAAERSPRACFHWGVLYALDDRKDEAIAWLERATRLQPDSYWYHFYLAYQYADYREVEQALAHYDVAIALEPNYPWARFNRSEVYKFRGAWGRAREDLETALAALQGRDRLRPLLNLGLVHLSLGNTTAARAAFDEVMEQASPDDPLARAALLDRASVDVYEGHYQRALDTYERLLADGPNEPALLGRALVCLSLGQPQRSVEDLTTLLEADIDKPDLASYRANLLSFRAEALLALGSLSEASEDAAKALRLDHAKPARERLWIRTQLALGNDDELRFGRPEEYLLLPGDYASLRRDLWAAARRLRAEGEAISLNHSLARATILSALSQHDEAEAEATRALTRWPSCAKALLVRARVNARAHNWRQALQDISQGLELEPDDPRFLALRGMIRTEQGAANEGLADLNRAARRGADELVHPCRAEALQALMRYEEAIDEWSEALLDDPQNPLAYLGRAQAFLQLDQPDQALADLEKAAQHAQGRPGLLARVTLEYAALLRERPNRLGRVLKLARLTWKATVPDRTPAVR